MLKFCVCMEVLITSKVNGIGGGREVKGQRNCAVKKKLHI